MVAPLIAAGITAAGSLAAAKMRPLILIELMLLLTERKQQRPLSIFLSVLLARSWREIEQHKRTDS